MTRKLVVVMVLVVGWFLMNPAFGLYIKMGDGLWPADGRWPAELDSLRKQSSTYRGGRSLSLVYVIPFTAREDFESAWPHLLSLKSKDSPLVLLRGPDDSIGKIEAGVHMVCVGSAKQDETDTARKSSGEVIAKEGSEIEIYLICDGRIVDLNRIALPADTKIVDLRFDR